MSIKGKQSFTSKFAPKRNGPHVICHVVTLTTFEVSNIDKPEIPLGKYHISALTPYHGTEEHVPMQPLRRKGRPPKLKSKPSFNVSNSVSNDSPAEVSQPSAQKIGDTPTRKPYLLRAPKPKPPCCVESRTGRTRDSKGEIVMCKHGTRPCPL
ncbi:hypothetical protein NQ314_020516 [Rhamnusium bicolor]|uniref:Uncharacterized protein n=1 Tax=Rhamnusium bicolor TaxID=1586634 RepID=A0AAV8WJX9_9CUCU|nr:hypothetical protein NQ314_020516 [Rhamnusium bicolor]